jgi:hypothetical protein
MNLANKLLSFGLICMTLSVMVGMARLAMGQVQAANNATNNATSSSLGTRLGEAIAHLIAPAFLYKMGVEVTYNANGNITHVCLKPGGPMFNYLLSRIPPNISNEQITKVMDEKHLMCSM